MQRKNVELDKIIQTLYAVFSRYSPGQNFCEFCYSDDEIRKITNSRVSDLDAKLTRKLLWESGDYFQDTDTYKHYLPRILEALAPPELLEDLFPAHLFETLEYHKFQTWPEYERRVISDFLAAVSKEIRFSDLEDQIEWKNRIKL